MKEVSISENKLIYKQKVDEKLLIKKREKSGI